MDPINEAVSRAEARLDAGDPVGAARFIEQFEDARAEHPRLAMAWARLLRSVGNTRVLERQMRALSAEWPHHPGIALATAEAGTRWTDPWPTTDATDRLAALSVDVIERCLSDARLASHWRSPLHLARARALARMGPAAEDEALAAFETGLEADPTSIGGWADLARLHQVRRRWQKGLAAAEHALDLADSRQARWTAAVCATALGVPSASDHWATLDHPSTQVGADGRPRMDGLPQIEVYLSSLIPGLPDKASVEDAAEVVWVQPISPVHGRIASPTVLDLPADFDDLIIWDPVPRGFRTVDGVEVPCFNALTVLAPGRFAVWRVTREAPEQAPMAPWPEGWRFYDFAARITGAEVAGKARLITPVDVSADALRAALAGRGLTLDGPDS